MLKTKDYIYLDEELLNSHLAQFEKGLLIKEATEHGVESSDSANSANAATFGFNGIFGIGAQLQNEITEGNNSVESDFTRNMVENVLHDYAVDLLIEDCNTNNALHDLESANEGDFISFCSEFQIYDFEYLKDITDKSAAELLLSGNKVPEKPSSQASRKERIDYQVKSEAHTKTKEGYALLNAFASFADILFADSILIKLNGCLAICKRNRLRLSKAQISFENESSRKIKIFGVVSTTKKDTHPNGRVPTFSTSDLDKVPSVFFDILLSNFNLLHKNDKIIKPIAIYFEAD